MQTTAWHRLKWNSLKWGSLALSLAAIVVTIILMQSGGPQQAAPARTAEKPKTEVESPVIIERKDGKITWQLRAGEASQQLDGNMHLSQPTLVLYTESGQKINIDSDQAWFEPVRRDVRFKDHVVVHFNAWTMHSDLMLYVSAKDEIQVPGTFRLTGKSIKAHGKNMHFHRTTEELNVEEGIWIQDTDSHWQGAAQ